MQSFETQLQGIGWLCDRDWVCSIFCVHLSELRTKNRSEEGNTDSISQRHAEDQEPFQLNILRFINFKRTTFLHNGINTENEYTVFLL